MQNVTNPLVTMYQAQLEVSRQFADALFSGTEKIDRVVIGATRRAFDDQMNLAEAMSTVRDPRSAGTTIQSNLLSHNPDYAVNYQKEIMRIVAEMQNEIGKSLQAYVELLRTNASVGAGRTAETAQTQAKDALFNPVTSMFSVWESAFKDVTALAKNNMSASRAAFDKSMSNTARHAGNYADVEANAAQGVVKNAASFASGMAAESDESGSDERKGSHSGSGKKK